MPVMMKQIAAEIGLSVSTISQILNDKGQRYRPQTRERVLAKAKEMGYRPNLLAQSLRGQATHMIALVVSNLAGQLIVMGKLASIEDLAWEAGYRVVFGAAQNNPQREKVYIHEFLSRQMDGFIIYPTGPTNAPLMSELIAQHMPLVTIESPFDLPTANVTVNRERGGYLQVRHLLDIGRRKIAFLAHGLRSPEGQAKLRGHRRALEEAGIGFDAGLLFELRSGKPDIKTAGAELARWALHSGRAFDAVVTTSDSAAMGVMRVLLEAGLRIPEDVALVGFDNDFYTTDLRVPLSTIHQPRGVGRYAFELLMEQINTPAAARTPREIALEPHLVIRESTVGDRKAALLSEKESE